MNPAWSGAHRNPRILIVGTHLSEHGGHRTPSEDLRDRLREVGELEVLSCSDRRLGLTRLAHTLGTIVRHSRRIDLAIIDVFSGRAFVLAELARAWAARTGARTALTLHGGGLPDFAKRKRDRVQGLLLSADYVTSPSAYLAESFSDVRDVKVLPNAIDLAQFSAEQDGDGAGRSPGASPHLLWVRAFHAIYRPWDAVEILHRVGQIHEDARLTMIGADKGDGSLQRVRDTARRFGLEERVLVIPGIPHEDIAGMLRSADVFLNTTSVDNTPMSVLEALAIGVPVVTTAAGGLPHLVEHGRSALLSPIGDIESMATQVLAVLKDPAVANRLREGGWAIAAAHDWSRILPRWQDLIRDATESRSQ